MSSWRGRSADKSRKRAWDMLSEADEYEALCRRRLEHRVEIREPLVLVSQIQRSGGTLLAQLFDGHPECHVDPYELKIGHPKKHDWPVLDLGEPDSWFPTLSFRGVSERLRRTERTRRPDTGRSIFPFLFLPRLQKAIFDACVAAREIGTERDVLDCYFTSYFNAWLDNHNLYSGPKRAVVGFVPRLAMDEENVERLFATYPDGALVSVVRDPRGWFGSAARYMPRVYGDVETAMGMWRKSTESALEAKRRFGERVVVLTYEQLVQATEPTMRRLAERLGLTMSPALLEPTFNLLPISANSSFGVEGRGVLPERATAYREVLGADTVERIESLAGDLYERAAGVASAALAR